MDPSERSPKRAQQAVGIAAAAAALAMAGPAATAAYAVKPAKITMIWVKPTGTGTTCTHKKPCSIETGFTKTFHVSESRLTIEPGHYGSPGSPITDVLDTAQTDTVRGEAGKPMPVIYTDADGTAMTVGGEGGWFKEVYSGTGIAIDDFYALDHVNVTSTGDDGCEVDGAKLTDSLCVDTLADGVALYDDTERGHSHLVNDTAVDEADGGDAVECQAAVADATETVNLVNVIAHGDASGYDVGVFNDQGLAGGNIVVNIDHTAVDNITETELAGGGTTDVQTGAGDTSAPPKFVDVAHGNYREGKGSPTVDKGAKENGTDLAGNPRTLGKATDIGAYELPVRPRSFTLRRHGHTPTTASVHATVNPEGLPTRVTLTAKHDGRVSHFSKRIDGDRKKTVSWTITGLAPGTTVHVSATAVNKAGRAGPKKLTTRTG